MPNSVKEALSGEYAEEWHGALKIEYDYLQKN